MGGTWTGAGERSSVLVVSCGHDRRWADLDRSVLCPGPLSRSLGALCGFARGGRRGRPGETNQGSSLGARGCELLMLLAVPAAFFAWRPGADPDPDRWGYFELALVVAHLQADDLDAAIDALDDARATDPHAVASAAIAGKDWVHEQWKAAVGRAWAAASNGPERSLLRIRPVGPGCAGDPWPGRTNAGRGRANAPRRADVMARTWRLVAGPAARGRQSARQRAVEAYRRASSDPSARIELALLTSDPPARSPAGKPSRASSPCPRDHRGQNGKIQQ